MNFYNKLVQRYKQSSFFHAALSAHAASFSIQPSSTQTDIDFLFLLKAIRLLAVMVLLIVGIKGAKAGFDWYHWEGSAAKRKEAKELLSKMLLIATAVFFLLVLLKLFIPA